LAEKKTGLRAILVVTGPHNSGKTTISTLLGEGFSDVSLLYIDASRDQHLSHSLSPDKISHTLGQVFATESYERKTPKPDHSSTNSLHSDGDALTEVDAKSLISGGREAIDWTFTDLTTPVGDDSDLLVVGNLNFSLEIRDQEKLAYGLKRLIKGYEAVIIDGDHPLILSILPQDLVHVINVITPQNFSSWQTSTLDEQATSVLILNQYSDEELPHSLEEALQQQHLRLLAKIPQYANEAERAQKMSQQLESAFLRLNIPMFPV
jgi:cellulose biosynthesis protein BcsQ